MAEIFTFDEVKQKADSTERAETSTSTVQMVTELDTSEPDEVKPLTNGMFDRSSCVRPTQINNR